MFFQDWDFILDLGKYVKELNKTYRTETIEIDYIDMRYNEETGCYEAVPEGED